MSETIAAPLPRGIRVLVVDNHDSFVHTLVGYLQELGAEVDLIEADAGDVVTRAGAGYDGVLLSPGPGTPEDAGDSIAVVHACARSRRPLLGVCLGHQAIAVAFGGAVGHASELMHGRTSTLRHDGSGVFDGIPSAVRVARYHSLAIEPGTLPSGLRVTATTPSGVIMGIAHRTLAIEGVQFHPESVLTEGGYRMIGNWLESIGLAGAASRGARLSPHREVG